MTVPMHFEEWADNLGVNLATVSPDDRAALELGFECLADPVEQSPIAVDLIAEFEANLNASMVESRKLHAAQLRQQFGIVD